MTQVTQQALCLRYRNDEQQMFIEGEFGNVNRLFDDVRHVRQTYGDDPADFEFDAYTTHHVLYHQSKPVGVLSPTRVRDGAIDCEQFYPRPLLDAFGHQTVSACKLRMLPNPTSGMSALRSIIREAWRHQLSEGVRIDMINVATDLLPFYRRIGYVAITGTEFVHPMLGTASVVMVTPADPNRRSFAQDLFAEVPDPLLLSDVRAALAGSPYSIAGKPHRAK